jgi:hypothetical protein
VDAAGHFQVGQLSFCAYLIVIFSRPTRYFLEVDVLSEEGGSRHSVPDGRYLASNLLTPGSLNPTWQQPHQSSTTTTNTEIAKDKSAISKCSTVEKIVKPVTTEQREDNYRQQERKTDAFSSDDDLLGYHSV